MNTAGDSVQEALMKPFDPIDLLGHIRAVLRRRGETAS